MPTTRKPTVFDTFGHPSHPKHTIKQLVFQYFWTSGPPNLQGNIRFLNAFRHRSHPNHKKTIIVLHLRPSEPQLLQENHSFFYILRHPGPEIYQTKNYGFQYVRIPETCKSEESQWLFNTLGHPGHQIYKKTNVFSIL